MGNFFAWLFPNPKKLSEASEQIFEQTPRYKGKGIGTVRNRLFYSSFYKELKGINGEIIKKKAWWK